MIIVAIALTTAPRVARVARGAAQPVVERDFVAATESMGVSRVRILTGELFPNILGPMMVEASSAADLLDRRSSPRWRSWASPPTRTAPTGAR